MDINEFDEPPCPHCGVEVKIFWDGEVITTGIPKYGFECPGCGLRGHVDKDSRFCCLKEKP